MANNFGDFIGRIGNEGRKYAEITKLNNQISGTTGRIHQLYREIGEIYYQKHLHDADPQMSKYISAITEMKSNIDVWNDQIQDLKGLTKCSHCGKIIPKNIMFCSGCGQRTVPDHVTLCPGCGSVIAKETLFCSNCGQRIPEEKPVEEKVPLRCVNCNTILEDNALFCPSCGTKVELSDVAEEPFAPVDSSEETGIAVAPVICSVCSEVVEDGQAFCPNCGTPVQQGVSEPQNASETVITSQPNVCHNCGTPLAEGELLCSHCGAEVL